MEKFVLAGKAEVNAPNQPLTKVLDELRNANTKDLLDKVSKEEEEAVNAAGDDDDD